MHFSKFNKTMTGVLIMTLVVSAASPAVTVRASNTTAETTQSESAGEGNGQPGGGKGNNPPSGAPSGQKPPQGGDQSGKTPPSGAPDGQPSQKDGESGQTPPSGAPSGQTPPEAPGGGMGGADTMTYDYKGTYEAALTADGKEETSNKETYTASDTDQNAALIKNAGTLTFTEGTLKKSGDDTNGDNCNFYGVNSILLAVNKGSTAYISGSSLEADSEGSNGIFATDDAYVYANNNTITTTAGNSRGLDATYGGTIIANQMTISTKGDHSATIATDRGGGSISVTNSTLNTAGSGSPLLYSTGSIEVDQVTGTASGSQIAGMEGLNTIRIYNSSLTSTNTGTTGSDPVANGVIIYQSTSGDAEATTGETATFEVADSTLKSVVDGGTMFYLTNTEANIVLSNTVLDFDSSKSNLLTVQGNDSNNWGTAGSNGAKVKFTGLGQTLAGNIDVDTISSLNMYLLKNTTYTGATAISDNAVNTDASSAPITMNVDSSSQWVVTGDSTVTDLNAESGSAIVDNEGKTVSIVANGQTVVTGTSGYTVTVTGSYSTTVTTDDSNQLSTSYIDRTAFDQYFGITTSFGENSGAAESTAETPADISSDSQNQTADTNNSRTATAVAIVVVCAVLGGGLLYWFKRKRK
jgi:hypothetical protein